MDLAWFTREQQDTLCLAPFWVFSSLIGRHGRLDDVELGVLVQCAQLATVAPGELVAEVLASVQRRAEALAALYEHDSRSVSAGLLEVAVALCRTSQSEAHMFKCMLTGDLGVLLATAVGPFGRSAKAEDLLRLQLLPALLEEPGPLPFRARGAG